MSKLKPCPFCGSKAIINIIPPHTHKIATFMPDYDGGAFVECTNCSCGIAASNRAEAVEAWNTRAEPLLANGVIVPPCKIGDTVYQTDGVRVYESTVKKVLYVTDGIAFDESAIGSSVFLKREEAELKGGVF